MGFARKLFTSAVTAVVMLGVATPALAGPADIGGSGAAEPKLLSGANDWNCKPSAAHPRPVVLVHGTWVDMDSTWEALAPVLADEGYCVFALNYGMPRGISEGNLFGLLGGADIAESARQLSDFVDRVRTETGSSQVDVVGHSQGGTLARQYLRFAGGADHANPALNKVHTLVTLGATNHGTSFGDVQLLGGLLQALGIPVTALAGITVGPSYIQQMTGSPFLEKLNADGDTDPGINYTVVASKKDTVSTPPEATFLTAGPGATVKNVWVQDGCESNTAGHDGLTSDPRAMYIIQVALDPTYADRHAAPCDAG